jgi:hypothetical protein
VRAKAGAGVGERFTIPKKAAMEDPSAGSVVEDELEAVNGAGVGLRPALEKTRSSAVPPKASTAATITAITTARRGTPGAPSASAAARSTFGASARGAGRSGSVLTGGVEPS